MKIAFHCHVIILSMDWAIHGLLGRLDFLVLVHARYCTVYPLKFYSLKKIFDLGALRSRTPGPRTQHQAHPGTRIQGHALKNHAKNP